MFPPVKFRRRQEIVKKRYYDRLVQNFLNARKKTLAFSLKLGVASRPVQGLKFSLGSYDGETRQEDQWVRWSTFSRVNLLALWISGENLPCFVFFQYTPFPFRTI